MSGLFAESAPVKENAPIWERVLHRYYMQLVINKLYMTVASCCGTTKVDAKGKLISQDAISVDDDDAIVKLWAGFTLNHLIAAYGQQKGQKMFDDYREKYSRRNTGFIGVGVGMPAEELKKKFYPDMLEDPLVKTFELQTSDGVISYTWREA